MNVLFNLIVVLQVVSALAIIGLVLVQHGKGADMGAAFGSGASGSLFGASGSSNFLSKSTAIAAAIFFSATLALAYFGTSRPAASVSGGVMERAPATAPANNAGNAVPNTAPAPAAAPAVPAATQDVPTAPAGQAGAGSTGAPAPAK
ncbi:preprotein translocase subunit SecG [Massilia norwichensis]|uniref:Protein-export membrane protein SecG n=1 Tax=Massilia norwichensis TaxID=1442366 RepID=A0ABT2A9F4_9BURK|nr:preprotein translocase subunit SecG [Massilia norwichensis]MCS0590829.1 preprotein translocase subunit SecG [Massilia norwichensis]